MLLHPRYFSRDVLDAVQQKLYADVEGTCTPKLGYIIAVTAINDIGTGRVLDGRGSAVFDVRYTAVVWRVFKDEVVDAIVSDVTDLAIIADLGPTKAVVHRNNLPPEYNFQRNANPPCYQTADQVRTPRSGETPHGVLARTASRTAIATATLTTRTAPRRVRGGCAAAGLVLWLRWPVHDHHKGLDHPHQDPQRDRAGHQNGPCGPCGACGACGTWGTCGPCGPCGPFGTCGAWEDRWLISPYGPSACAGLHHHASDGRRRDA